MPMFYVLFLCHKSKITLKVEGGCYDKNAVKNILITIFLDALQTTNIANIFLQIVCCKFFQSEKIITANVGETCQH